MSALDSMNECSTCFINTNKHKKIYGQDKTLLGPRLCLKQNQFHIMWSFATRTSRIQNSPEHQSSDMTDYRFDLRHIAFPGV